MIDSARLWKARVEQRILACNNNTAESLQADQPALSNGQEAHPQQRATDFPHARGRDSVQQQKAGGTLSTPSVETSVSTPRDVHPQRHQDVKLPSSLRSIGSSLPAGLAATSSIPVTPAHISAPNYDYDPPLHPMHPTIAAEHTHQNGAAGSSSTDRGSSIQRPDNNNNNHPAITPEVQLQQQHQQAAAVWQQGLQSVKQIMEAEVGRVCDGEHVSCIQLHIAGGESLGVQYIDYSCVYILQVCPLLLSYLLC